MYAPPTKSYEDLRTELTAIDYKLKNAQHSPENLTLLLQKRREINAEIAKLQSHE